MIRGCANESLHALGIPPNKAKCQARGQKSERMKADEGRPQGRPFDVAVPPGTARGGAFSGALHDRNRPQAVRSVHGPQAGDEAAFSGGERPSESNGRRGERSAT